MKAPKDPRLSDGWRWERARAFFPLSSWVSTQRSPGGVHTATDVRCVENLASLLCQGSKSSSQVAGHVQYGVLKTSTATEIMVHREGVRIAPHLDLDQTCLATKELARDMQTLCMLPTLELKRFALSQQCSSCVSVLRLFG